MTCDLSERHKDELKFLIYLRLKNTPLYVTHQGLTERLSKRAYMSSGFLCPAVEEVMLNFSEHQDSKWIILLGAQAFEIVSEVAA